MIKSIVWANMLDYPGQVATTLFVGTCQWRCEFCQNIPLLSLPSIDFENDILPKLIKRKTFINNIVISGGECTDHKNFNYLVKTLKANELTIGIHTNGSNPEVLKQNINNIDYIGMDIKTTPDKYSLITKRKVIWDDILQSIKLIKEKCNNYEFRTTMFPKYVTKEDCIYIAKLLSSLGVKEYYLQQYSDENLPNTYIVPYDKDVILDIQHECNKYIATKIKGI